MKDCFTVRIRVVLIIFIFQLFLLANLFFFLLPTGISLKSVCYEYYNMYKEHFVIVHIQHFNI